MNCRVIGLTGGIGMGKSATAELFSRRGVPIADTDLIAREVVEPGQPALGEIRAAFGNEVIGMDGCLRREELARRVFSDTDARRQLESIVHPRIRATWQQAVAGWRAGGQALGVVVIPLLFETNAADSFDFTLCAACTAATQRERLIARGWSSDEIARRIQAQLPIERKMSLATHVLWTEGSLELLGEQLDRILSPLPAHPNGQ